MVANMLAMLEDKFLKEFGLKIKYYRSKRNYTQAKLGEMVEISEHRISQIENGKCNITLKTVAKIINALDVNSAKVFDFD